MGAHYENSRRGAAYVFRTLDGGATYVEVDKLTASDAASYNYFGYSVAIDGNTTVIGAYGDYYERGAAYVFRTTDGGANYLEVAKLTASDASSYDYFGNHRRGEPPPDAAADEPEGGLEAYARHFM